MARHVCSDVCAPCSASVLLAVGASTIPAPSMRHSTPSPAPVHAFRSRFHVFPPSLVLSW
eukprot:7278534-Prorocentrum_lima.AAC.1